MLCPTKPDGGWRTSNYDQVIEVPAIAGTSTTNLQLIGPLELHKTLNKVYLWSLSQYDRVLYLDADTLVPANLDHLFLLPGHVEFAASPELGFLIVSTAA